MFEAINSISSQQPANDAVISQGIISKSSGTPAASTYADTASSADQVQAAQKVEEGRKTENAQEEQVTQKMLEELEQDIESMHSVGLRFAKFKASGQTYVKVIDKTNDEVIREIPSEDVLKLAVKMEEMIGILFDKQA